MQTNRWEIDSAHSVICFWVTPVLRGRFTRWSGRIEAEVGQPDSARIDVLVDATSVETGSAVLDQQLRGPAWLDVHNHPEATFRSTHVRVLKNHRLRATGVLWARGLEIVLLVGAKLVGHTRDPWGNQRVTLTAKAALAPWVLGAAPLQQVDLTMELQAVKQPALLRATP